MGAQLWTAERAVHAAALFAVRGDPRHADLAARILRAYTARYSSWPNVDNVLGPTRPFFSTYLESIWLLNLCHAVALLEGASPVWTSEDATRVRDALIAPSAALIDGYHEGRSNRQVWNEVAICSAWRLLGLDERVRERLAAASGIRGMIDAGLDAEGFWYEGENYHLFAHRGLWYGVELMRVMDVPLPDVLDARYTAGFVAPFLGVLPDDTFPSRRDSQYASSIRQWRTAEWCELGWAHSHDVRLAGLLSTLYDGRVARRDTGRSRSTADAERNAPPTALSRADLSWRALLMADPDVPTRRLAPPGNVCLPSQGLAVIRRDLGRTYVALEGGQSGGGHGHPDLLALTLQTGDARWLQDPGTGSYVEDRLSWYRSSWSHHAPLFDGRSQAAATAHVEAFDERDGVGWIVKRVDGIAPGVNAERTIVVADGYLIDFLEWESGTECEMSLPIAAVADVVDDEGSRWRPLRPRVPDAADPGRLQFDPAMTFMFDSESLVVHAPVELVAYPSSARRPHEGAPPRDVRRARAWYAASVPALLQRAIGPAPPGQGEMQRHWISARAARGRLLGVWSWPTDAHPHGQVATVALSPSDLPTVRVEARDGASAVHTRTPTGWHVARVSRFERRLTDLDRRSMHPDGPAASSTASTGTTSKGPRASDARVLRVPRLLADGLEAPPGATLLGACTIDLGESHYVGTERRWGEADAPSARVQLAVAGDWLVADVDVQKSGPIVVADVAAANPLDNEPHDVNADGIQWYMNPADPSARPSEGWVAAGLVVPARAPQYGTAGRQMPIVGPHAQPQVWWRPTEHGWAMRLRWEIAQLPVGIDGELAFELVVNERPPWRERRRGQLVLSGGGGFGYLAGCRRPVERFVLLSIVPPFGRTTFR